MQLQITELFRGSFLQKTDYPFCSSLIKPPSLYYNNIFLQTMTETSKVRRIDCTTLLSAQTFLYRAYRSEPLPSAHPLIFPGTELLLCLPVTSDIILVSCLCNEPAYIHYVNGLIVTGKHPRAGIFIPFMKTTETGREGTGPSDMRVSVACTEDEVSGKRKR